MTRIRLVLFFSGILLIMLAVTTYASLDRSVFEVGRQLTSDPWFQATLIDAYCGFLTFYVWVAYKETTVIGRFLWFVLIMTLGNIAMSVYALIQLWRWDPDRGIPSLLCRKL